MYKFHLLSKFILTLYQRRQSLFAVRRWTSDADDNKIRDSCKYKTNVYSKFFFVFIFFLYRDNTSANPLFVLNDADRNYSVIAYNNWSLFIIIVICIIFLCKIIISNDQWPYLCLIEYVSGNLLGFTEISVRGNATSYYYSSKIFELWIERGLVANCSIVFRDPFFEQICGSFPVSTFHGLYLQGNFWNFFFVPFFSGMCTRAYTRCCLSFCTTRIGSHVWVVWILKKFRNFCQRWWFKKQYWESKINRKGKRYWEMIFNNKFPCMWELRDFLYAEVSECASAIH